MSQYSQEQLELQAHIQKENRVARAENHLFTTVECLDHWADYGIVNISQYEHHCAVEAYIDAYKSEHNVKPRWIDFSKMTTEQIWADYEVLTRSEEEQEAIDKAELDAALKRNAELVKNKPFANLKEMMATAS